MKAEVKDNEGEVILQSDQSAAVFDADGNVTLYFPKPKGGDNEPVNDGAMAMLRVAVLLGDSKMGQLMRGMADAQISGAKAKAELEQLDDPYDQAGGLPA